MSTLRKYRPLFVEPKKKPKLTVERTLFAGFVGLTGVGLAQPAIMSYAFNDTSPATTMTAQTNAPVMAGRPTADYTPVGSIERKPIETAKPAEPAPANPLGLRRAH